MFSAKELNASICFVSNHGRLTGILLSCFILIYDGIFAQEKIPCNEITGEMGYTVQTVRIIGRWIPRELQEKAELIAGLGLAFDPPRISAAMELVRDELIKNENDFAIRLIGSTSVLYVDSESCDISDSSRPKQVGVVIRAYYLRIDLYNLGKNVLPVPRSAKPAFYQEVPALLLATSPIAGFTNDRHYGPSVTIQTTTDLLDASRIKKNHPSQSLRLMAEVDGRKSLNHPFHTFGIAVNLLHPIYSDTMTGWNVGVRYEHTRQPLSKGQYERGLFRVNAAIQGSSKKSIFKRYALGAGARFLQNRYYLVAGSDLENRENGYELFALSDGRLAGGFSRFGIWFDTGIPGKSTGLKSFQRLSTRLGYGVVLGSGHKNADLEAILGGGHTWGTAPPYNQFFAGNAAGNYLYEPFNSGNNSMHPKGPVIRSLGEQEGGLRSPNDVITGGGSYLHLNLNFSIPVSKWARPLIPDIVISEEPRRLTLRTALKGQVNSAKNFILDDLVNNQGLPDNEQTEAVADRIIDKDIRPTLDYLSERANVYAIKPLLLVDIAHINDRVLKSKTWLAAGLGVQLNIVIARFEMAYMRTLSPPSDSGTGNLFLRITVQNFY